MTSCKKRSWRIKKAARARAVEKLAAAIGKLRAVRSKKFCIERLKQGEAQHTAWLESQLNEGSSDLKKTTKRHEDHTNHFDMEPVDVQRTHGGKANRSLSLRPIQFL